MLLLPVLCFLFVNVFGLQYVEVKGYISGVDYKDTSLGQVHGIVSDEIIKRIPDANVDVISIEGSIDVVFTSQISSGFSKDELMGTLINLHPVVLLIWREFDKPQPPMSSRAMSSSLPYCQNDGILMPDNLTCKCGSYSSGHSCEIINCQNWAVQLDETYPQHSRCYCAPGHEAHFCETRGCRPAVEDNQIPKQRTFIIVEPMIDSMNQTRYVIANNTISAVTKLQANDPGCIDTYIWCIFIGTEHGATIVSTFSFKSLTDMVYQMQTIGLSTPEQKSVNQNLMYAIDTTLRQSRSLYPNSIVLSFTDRMEDEAVEETFTPSQNTLQMRLTQRALAWQIKLFFFLIQDPVYQMDYSSQNYNIFRQLATYTHGEVFVIERNDVADVMNNVVPFFYKPQNTEVRSFTKCDTLNITLPEERTYSTVKIVVNIDRNNIHFAGADTNSTGNYNIQMTDQSNGNLVDAQVIGKYYKLYSIDNSSNINAIQISISPTAICSVKVFVSAEFPALLTYSDNSMVDVGSSLNYAEGNNSILASFNGFAPAGGVSHQVVNAATGQALLASTEAKKRISSWDCSADYVFDVQPKCAIGTYTQKLRIPIDGGRIITRVLPGLCVHHANVTITYPSPTQPPQPPVKNGQISCDVMNYQDLNEPRLHQFDQIVFAIEITTQMKNAVNNFISILDDVLNGIMARDNGQKQYTLITFDYTGYTARVDENSPSYFSNKAKAILTDLFKNVQDPQPWDQRVYSTSAAYAAIQLQLRKAEVIHVFTASGTPYATNNLNYFRPAGVQMNYYWIREDLEEMFFPMDIQRNPTITGGRLIPMPAAAVNTMVDALIDSTFENSFIFDGSIEDCSNKTSFDFFVEKAATSVSVVIVGRNVSLFHEVTDGVKPLSIRPGDIRLSAPNAVILKFDLAAKGALPGNWTLFTSTSSGCCFLQVRAESTVNAAIGFTSSKTNDMVAKHPYARGSGSDDSFYVAARIVSAPVILKSVVLESFPIEIPWNTKIYANLTNIQSFQMRDLDTCAYQFISDPVQLPYMWALRITINGVENPTNAYGYPFQRRFFYYNDGSSYCSGIERLPTGQCKCDSGFTGEFCFDPSCQNGGISNNGACACPDGFTGSFCETCYYDTCLTEGGPDPNQQTTEAPETATRSSSVTLILSLIVILIAAAIV